VRPTGSWKPGIRLRALFAGAAARGLLDHPFSEDQSEALVEALLLGERRNLDRATNEAFRRTGLLHLISLSGMHMGILVGIVWWLCKPVGFSKRTRALVCASATGVFLLIVPPLGPILRAAVIVWAYCAALLLRRRSSALNSLALAALVLLLVQPTQLFEAGWQLSFASVAGILAFTRRIEDFVHERTRDWFHRTSHESTPVARGLKAAGCGAIKVLSVGAAAWLASAGVLLYHFYNLTPLAGLWTALASPFVTAIVVLGFVKIVLSFLFPTLSLLLGHLLMICAEALIWTVNVLARIDFSYIQIGHVPLLLIVLYYGLVLSVAFVHLRRPILKRALCTALALLLVVPLGVLKWQRTHRDHVRLTCLDVGHGQALLVQLPGTTNLLFDAGSLYHKDVGARVVIPCLDYLGLGRLHAIVASHHDVDHINGIPEVVSFRRVDRVYLGDSFFTPPARPAAGLLLEHLDRNRIRPEPIPAAIPAGATPVRVLWPAGDPSRRETLSENDRSLVCLIEYAGRKVLLCSDIEKPAQREILALYPALQADVVVAPHHGSAKTTDEAFLRQLAPTVLLCSCGRTDYERGRVLRIADRGKLLFTAHEGAITVCIDRTGTVRPATGKR
ncbi:MAG: MBL fold metallo-hydrolase, partial [Planctomycetes bacterium]|nr:MBL fold metallo-hydrolase [Planctomycetota bacterium]